MIDFHSRKTRQDEHKYMDKDSNSISLAAHYIQAVIE